MQGLNQGAICKIEQIVRIRDQECRQATGGSEGVAVVVDRVVGRCRTGHRCCGSRRRIGHHCCGFLDDHFELHRDHFELHRVLVSIVKLVDTFGVYDSDNSRS